MFVNNFPKFRLVCAVRSSHRMFSTKTPSCTQNASVPVITTGIAGESADTTILPVDNVGRNTDSPREPEAERDSAGNGSKLGNSSRSLRSSRSSNSAAFPAGSAWKFDRSVWIRCERECEFECELELCSRLDFWEGKLNGVKIPESKTFPRLPLSAGEKGMWRHAICTGPTGFTGSTAPVVSSTQW